MRRFLVGRTGELLSAGMVRSSRPALSPDLVSGGTAENGTISRGVRHSEADRASREGICSTRSAFVGVRKAACTAGDAAIGTPTY